jgi:hypothetical protein
VGALLVQSHVTPRAAGVGPNLGRWFAFSRPHLKKAARRELPRPEDGQPSGSSFAETDSTIASRVATVWTIGDQACSETA